MRTYPKTLTVAMIGLVALTALVLFGPSPRELAAHARLNTPAVNKQERPAPQYKPIVPADVLGTGTPWPQATGDGSN